ncbi:MAG: DUF4835 family protein [Prevotellaceae bacterium]|nr:DUF4835 family protein [Prevotellaceae bacterium]
MRKTLISLCLIFTALTINAQELYCRVSVSSQRIQGSTNRTIFSTLQQSLYEFVNNTNWSNHVYTQQERIECTMFINITEEINSGEFKGTLQVQSKRPVFGSAYYTTMINFSDNDIQFKYNEYDKIEFNENSHTSNLSSLIAYYAYLIVGFDYDSFSPRGGNEYFQKAQKIVANAQGEVEPGWKAFDGNRRNRYWIVDNILNSRYSSVRSAYYMYHRSGLDRMSERPSEAREQISQALTEIQKVYRDKPDPYLTYLKLFFDAKADEIVNIFSQGAMTDKVRVYNILAEVDNPNESKYKAIKESTSEF